VLPSDESSFLYSPTGNRTQSTVNGITTKYRYDDGKGNVTKIERPDGHNRTFSQYLFGIARTEKSTVLQTTQPLDYLERTVSAISRQVGSVTNGVNKTTRYQYDSSGRVNYVTTPNNLDSNISIARGRTSTTVTRGNRIQKDYFDRFGRIKKSEVSDGSQYIIVNRAFDVLGRLTFESFPHSNTSTPSQLGTYFEYDALSRKLSERVSAGAPGASDDLVTRYAYSGNTVQVTDRKDHTTTFSYRALGSPDNRVLIGIAQPEGVATTIDRSRRGDILKITQNGVSREYRYNGKYQLERIIQPEIADTVFTYDVNGAVETKRVGTGNTTRFEYDGRNNLIKTTFAQTSSNGAPNSETVTYEYRLDNSLFSVTTTLTYLVALQPPGSM